MHTVVDKAQLSPNVTRLVIEAPRIAEIRRPGQFVIVHRGPGAERIPLTIADADAERGTIAPGMPWPAQMTRPRTISPIFNWTPRSTRSSSVKFRPFSVTEPYPAAVTVSVRCPLGTFAKTKAPVLSVVVFMRSGGSNPAPSYISPSRTSAAPST